MNIPDERRDYFYRIIHSITPLRYCAIISFILLRGGSGRHDGVLLAARIAPEDVEDLRAARLEEALIRKCPKLQLCKNGGARTVLILEDRDISLSNYMLIGDRLAGILEARAGVPDEIYLVETSLDQWEVRPMKYDDECWPMESWTEFHVVDLIDLTPNVKG